jgi:hypothetical protein
MKQICIMLAAIILVLDLSSAASVAAQRRGSAKPKARARARVVPTHQIVSPRDTHSGQANAIISAPVDAHSGQKRGLVSYNGHAGLGSNLARRRSAQSRKVIQDGALTDDEYAVRKRKKESQVNARHSLFESSRKKLRLFANDLLLTWCDKEATNEDERF